MMPILEHWHEIAYGILALVFVIIYILHLIPNLKIHRTMEEFLHGETLLIVVLIFVAITAIRVEKVSNHVKFGTEEISGSLGDVLRSEGLARVEAANSIDELFATMNIARQHTSKEIRMLRMWGDSAEELSTLSSQAAIWYGEMDQWIQGAPGRILFRIIGVHDQVSEDVFNEQCRESARRGGRVVRKVDGILRDPDLNIVIFDQREVFLIVSPTGDLVKATKAYHIEDGSFAVFMTELFTSLMARAASCQ